MKPLDEIADSRKAVDGVSVLAKISALLEALALREQMTAADLAEALQEPRSSVHRLIRQLNEIGWIEPGRSRGHWAVGLHLFRLGSGAVQRMDVRRAALPHMQALNDECEETILLCVQRELEAVCIEIIPGRRVQSLDLVLGGAMPLHAGAGPLSLLAWASQDVRHEWLVKAAEFGLEPKNLNREPTITEIEEQIKSTRQRGYAVSDQNVTPGIGALGAPIFDLKGHIVAAVSVSGLRDSVFDPQINLASKIMDAAKNISFDLGYRDPESDADRGIVSIFQE
jgi:DNA-binding IclR family transcriptional regulator